MPINSPTLTKVDLIIVIDTSVSMKDEATSLSEALSAAMEQARTACPSDLRVEFLGIEGTFSGTKFTRTVRSYLSKLGVAADRLKGRKAGSLPGGAPQEDVARAVEDLAQHFDWRDGSERNLLVLGDESLEGGDMVLNDEKIAACDSAIATAIERLVKVHTYLGTPYHTTPYPTDEDENAMIREYRRLALRTGGEDYIYTRGIADFETLLKNTLCASKVPREESIADKQSEADKNEQDPSDKQEDATASTPAKTASPCQPCADKGSSVCANLPEIVKAVNTLADILHRLTEICAPDSARTPAPTTDKPCRCHEKPAAAQEDSPAQPESADVKPAEESAKPQEARPLLPTDKELIHAIVLQDNNWWRGNKDDNGDIWAHSALTGERVKKTTDSAQRMGQSNALTTDGYHYMVVDTSTVYRGNPAVNGELGTYEACKSLSGGYPSTDGFAFRQDNVGFFFHARSNNISWFRHDPANASPARNSLTIKPGAQEQRIAFGAAEDQWICDLAFDGNNRAWLLGINGDLWVVDDTTSEKEWKTRYVSKFPQLDFVAGRTRYIGIAFDSVGNVYLAGGQQESNNGCRRFIARSSISRPEVATVIYQGEANSASYGDLSSAYFPAIAL